MNVLSLFDGISCGQLALQRTGIKVDNYYASEIDKYAIQITQKNFPNTIQLGDINRFENWRLPQIDLLIGGSPCQDLSIAKKDRQGIVGKRSGLFWRYVDCIKKFKPQYFLLENVASMSKEAKQLITDALGVEPIMINSALVSGQQRRRLYWTNIPNIIQPSDKGIIVKDILENDKLADIINLPRSVKREVDLIATPIQNKNKSIYVGEYINNGYKNKNQSSLEYRIYSADGKAISLSSFQTNYKIDFPNGDYIIRKLTPIECERLQTLSDNYTAGISNSQRYKCIGNGWTVDVISWIFSFIPKVSL